MDRQHSRAAGSHEGVAALRAAVLAAAGELAAAGRAEEASLLEEAGELRSTPADEVLAMREALVRTREAWQHIHGAVAGEAAAALAAAKELSIRL